MPDVASPPFSGERVVGAGTGSIVRNPDAAPPTEAPGTGRVRLNLDLSAEIANFLDVLAQENATTKSDVMRRAIALLKVAHEEKKRNRTMGFITADRDELLETRVVGVL